MKNGKWLALLCAALLALSGCGARGNETTSSEEPALSSSSSSQQEVSSEEPPQSSQIEAAIDGDAYQEVLALIAGYEPDTAGSSLKIVIVAAKLLNFSEGYESSQEQALKAASDEYLASLEGEALTLFSDNLVYADKTAREILAGGDEIAARLEEAGNPQEFESYDGGLYEMVYAALNDSLAERLKQG